MNIKYVHELFELYKQQSYCHKCVVVVKKIDSLKAKEIVTKRMNPSFSGQLDGKIIVFPLQIDMDNKFINEMFQSRYIFNIFINSFRQAQENDANNRLKDNETALRTDIFL